LLAQAAIVEGVQGRAERSARLAGEPTSLAPRRPGDDVDSPGPAA